MSGFVTAQFTFSVPAHTIPSVNLAHLHAKEVCQQLGRLVGRVHIAFSCLLRLTLVNLNLIALRKKRREKRTRKRPIVFSVSTEIQLL